MATADGLDILYLPPDQVDAWWPACAPHLAAALRHSLAEYEVEDLHELAAGGDMQLWVVMDAGERRSIGAWLTQILAFPRRHHLRVVALGGERFTDWVGQGLAAVERFARDQGCDAVTLQGRPGWARRLSGLGFAEVYRELARDIR